MPRRRPNLESAPLYFCLGTVHSLLNKKEARENSKENVLAKLKDDKEKGRLSPSEYEVKVDQAYQQFAKIIDNWLRTSEIAFE